MAKNSGNTRKKNSENIKEAQISSNLRATYGDSWNINNFIKASPYFDEETVYENFKENMHNKILPMVSHKKWMMLIKRLKTLGRIKK